MASLQSEQKIVQDAGNEGVGEVARSSDALSIGNVHVNMMAADVASAISATFLVAPVISMVDKSIMLNASGRHTVPSALKMTIKDMVAKPGSYLRKPEFLLVWGVYTGTYISANSIVTYCEQNNVNKTTAGFAKFLGISFVNISLNVAKDRIFARMFGSGQGVVPLKSILLFGFRDAMTVGTSFNVSPAAAAYLAPSMGVKTATTFAQLSCPVAVQWLSAPLHLLGLDLYNRPKVENQKVRVELIRSQYLSTATARSARIFPAFGVGALLNTPLREKLHALFN